MIDAENNYFPGFVVDAIQDTVGATPCRVDPPKITAKWLAEPVWALHQATAQELDDRRRDGLGKLLSYGSHGGRSQDELEGPVRAHSRRDRTTSMPRTTSPLR